MEEIPFEVKVERQVHVTDRVLCVTEHKANRALLKQPIAFDRLKASNHEQPCVFACGNVMWCTFFFLARHCYLKVLKRTKDRGMRLRGRRGFFSVCVLRLLLLFTKKTRNTLCKGGVSEPINPPRTMTFLNWAILLMMETSETHLETSKPTQFRILASYLR